MDEQRGPLEYDFRTRFHRGLDEVPKRIGWGEALRLVTILRADPGSMLAAALEGWDYPLPRAEAIAMDQYDLAYAATGTKKRQPYPRPFKRDGERTKRGDAGGRTSAQVLALLRPGTPV
ncbi:MAG: hypothetical protein LH624_00095 [Cryobacterium sp.]|nr:hypothetical protein [Cryobacterium sp.]